MRALEGYLIDRLLTEIELSEAASGGRLSYSFEHDADGELQLVWHVEAREESDTNG